MRDNAVARPGGDALRARVHARDCHWEPGGAFLAAALSFAAAALSGVRRWGRRHLCGGARGARRTSGLPPGATPGPRWSRSPPQRAAPRREPRAEPTTATRGPRDPRRGSRPSVGMRSPATGGTRPTGGRSRSGVTSGGAWTASCRAAASSLQNASAAGGMPSLELALGCSRSRGRADRDQLLGWAQPVARQPYDVLLVPSQPAVFGSSIARFHGFADLSSSGCHSVSVARYSITLN